MIAACDDRAECLRLRAYFSRFHPPRSFAVLRVGFERGVCGVASLANGITIGRASRLASIRAQI
jgi:hypothetical protein